MFIENGLLEKFPLEKEPGIWEFVPAIMNKYKVNAMPRQRRNRKRAPSIILGIDNAIGFKR